MEYTTSKEIDMEETASNEADESDGEEECRSGVSVILSDLDIFDCPICFEPLKLPVFQCKNGHIACEPCCSKMKNKCGNCSLKIGVIRCRVIETLIESVKIPCRYTPDGCSKKLLYKEKLEHEDACEHTPYWCPCFDCDFVGKSSGFIKHIEATHSYLCKPFTFGCKLSLPIFIYGALARQVILRESNESNRDMVFVLSRLNEDLGSLFEVILMGRALDDASYSLLLSSSIGEHSFKMESVVDKVRKLRATTRSANFLLVPKKCIGTNGYVTVDVTISRNATTDRI